MTCAQCGTALLAGKAFCHACGAPTAPPCSRCGAALRAEFRFCPDCGQSVGAPTEAAPEPAVAPPPILPPPAPAPPVAVEPYVDSPPPELSPPRGVVEGERKLVTVFFCDLAGSTAIAERLDPEEYRELLEQYVALAFREIYRFEGMVNQLAGDGMMALFGAPIAREDAPVRAVWAALGIHEALHGLNERLRAAGKPELRARIGIHTGPVVVGTVGNDHKMDYTAIGDTTNLAARLESLATPGTTLLSEETFHLVRGFIEVRPVGPFAVKGKSEEVVAFEVVRRRDAVTPIGIAAERGLTPLVGRDEELAQMRGCYERAQGHLPQVVRIVGETGSGRSRLVYELKKSLSPVPRVFEARCSALNQRVPFHPWVMMLQDYFGIGPDESAESALPKVEARLRSLGHEVYERADFIYHMMSLPSGHAAEMPADEVERQTFEAVGHIFHVECQRQPVLVVIEDLHWIDQPSWAMLERAIGTLHHAPMMMLMTYRPEFQAQWTTSAVLTLIRLRRLSDTTTSEILRSVAGGHLPEELEAMILAKAEGSPFHAEEITRSLLEGGALERVDDHFQLARPLDEIRLPGTVQEVIAARLDSLGPEAKRVVQVAAVMGRQFRREQLETLIAEEGIDVGKALALLERRGVIHRKSIFSDDVYRFGESLTQEVAYEGLLLRQRRVLHERVGALLERAPGEWNAERSARVAHHYVNSDDTEKAVHALLRAALDAEKVPAFQAAAEYYHEAWDIAGGRDAEGETLRRLAVDAAQGLGRMVVLYGAPLPPDGLDILGRAADLAADLRDPGARAGMLTYQGMVVMTSLPGQFERGLAIVEEALAAAQLAGVPLPGMARGLAWAYLLDGRLELARRTIEWAIQELRESPIGKSLGDVYLGALYLRDRLHLYRGEWDVAVAGAQATRELAAKAGNRTVQSGSAATLAHVAYLRADDAETLRWVDIALAKAKEAGSPHIRRAEAALAIVAQTASGTDPARCRYRELVEGELDVQGEIAMGLAAIVQAILALGEPARARELARRGYEHAAGRFRRMQGALALAETLHATDPDSWDSAEALYGEAIELAAAIGVPSLRAQALLGAAELAWRRGDIECAASHLETLAQVLESSPMPRFDARRIALVEALGGGSWVRSTA